MLCQRNLGLWFALVLIFAGGLARGTDNLVRNGDFKLGTTAKGWPASWACAGDENVDRSRPLRRRR